MKNNLSLVLAILLLLVIACSCPKSETSQTSRTPTPPNTVVSTTPQVLLSNTAVPLKSNSAKSASVISENAYLRELPNGKISQTLPVASSVEVIKQKGAWFYVKSGTAKGWLHGNTIRYDNQSDVSSVPTTSSKSSTYTDSKPKPESDSSGASAKCRDGSLSYSRNRRGTCSHHGGVAVWY